MKAEFKKIFKILGVVFGNIFVGYMLLTLVYCIPSACIEENVKISATDLYTQGVYPSLYLKGTQLDSWTDADCISVTYNTTSNNPFYNAINAYQKNLLDNSLDGVERLYATVYETDNSLESIMDHSYLWHGFRIWLRPLLCIYELADIRYICFVINIVLLMLLAYLLYKLPGGIWNVIPFFAAYSYFNFQMESVSILFFNDISIMLMSCLAIIWAEKNKKDLNFVFSFIGFIVAFSSMLILPMLTIGFPIIVWLISTKGEEIKSRFIKIIKFSASWFIGYAVTLFSKIFISQVFINSNKGLTTVSNYFGATDYLTFSDRIDKLHDVFNYVVCTSEIRYHFIVTFIIFLIVYVFIHKKFSIRILFVQVPYFLVAVIPIVWILVMAGHSHHFWTCYNFSITIYALLQSLCNLCKENKLLMQNSSCLN